MARVDLLGEIERTAAGSARFRRGVREYAAIGDPVEMIGRAELNLIYASSSARAITVGHLSQDPSIPAYVDTDHMLAKHFAVVGSTGVGKSSAVASILGKMIEVRPELRVLLLDVHNEYRAAFGRRASVIGAENLRLPFWLFNFEEITNVIYGGKPASPEEVEILAELMPIAKAKYQAGPERLAVKPARHGGFTADTPMPYHLQDLLGLIHERMGKLENRSSSMSHHRLIQRIEMIRNDPRYEFMFKNANLGGDTLQMVLSQVFSLESEDQPLSVLKLASLPDEVVDTVVCVLARLAFDFALWSDGAIPILLGLRGGAPLRLGGPARRLRPGTAGAEADRPGGTQVRRPPRPRQPAAGRARPDDHLPVQHLLRDADDQRRGSGASALGGLGGGGEPARLRAVARRPGGDRDRRGHAAGGAHHLRHAVARRDPAQRIRAREGATATGRSSAARWSARRSNAGAVPPPARRCGRTRSPAARSRCRGASRSHRPRRRSGWRGPPRTASRRPRTRRSTWAANRRCGAEAIARAIARVRARRLRLSQPRKGQSGSPTRNSLRLG